MIKTSPKNDKKSEKKRKRECLKILEAELLNPNAKVSQIVKKYSAKWNKSIPTMYKYLDEIRQGVEIQSDWNQVRDYNKYQNERDKVADDAILNRLEAEQLLTKVARMIKQSDLDTHSSVIRNSIIAIETLGKWNSWDSPITTQSNSLVILRDNNVEAVQSIDFTGYETNYLTPLK